MATRDCQGPGDCECVLIGIFVCIAAVWIGGLFYLAWRDFTSGSPEYTVAITGVEGLDPAALDQRSNPPAALNPVIGIAVRIDNGRSKKGPECLGMHSSAVVSYGDAVLGKGTVPEFCASTLGVGEAAATAWGMDVQVPRFLRDRLAGELRRGEAVLDVAVRTPGNCHRCMDKVFLSKAKIGGDPAPCLVTYVYQQSTSKDEL